MRTLTETKRPPNVSVITGHFQEGPSYGTVRAHGTDDYLLMLTVQGRGRIGSEEGTLSCRPGDIVVLRSNTRHDYGTDRAAGEWEFLWAHFVPRSHHLTWLETWPSPVPGVLQLALAQKDSEDSTVYERVLESLLEMHRRANGGLRRRDEFALNSLEEALLWCDTVNPLRQESRSDPRVERAMAHMREHLDQIISLPDLADLVGLSASRFSHLFRAQTGGTPQRFLETQRIERAQQLLALTGRTIGAIAESVGYENPFYFTLRFTKRVGCAPSEWRRRQQRGGEADTKP